VLPLPDNLNQVIAGYLEKHEKYDDASADRLQEELTSIFNKSVNGRHERYAPFLAVLRQVRPALRTPARIVLWWDRFLDPVLDNLNIEKGLANEALKNVLQLLAFEEDEHDGPPSEGHNIFADRLLSRWMQLNALNQAATGSGSSDSKERFMQEAIMTFGKKDAKARQRPKSRSYAPTDALVNTSIGLSDCAQQVLHSREVPEPLPEPAVCVCAERAASSPSRLADATVR
jgi:hypothetical protein